jgi:hypothetical protein
MSTTQHGWSQALLDLALKISLNLCIKKVKRCGHGYRRFEHYRLRVLLHTGGITWPTRPRPPQIRSRRPPHSIA